MLAGSQELLVPPPVVEAVLRPIVSESRLAPPTVVAFVAFVADVALVAVLALVAWVALSAFEAEGTLPRLDSSTSAPLTELFAIFAPVTAPFAIFGFVTAFFFSCFAPTLFFGSEVAA